MAGGSPHIPVLPCEVLEWLAPRPDGLYIDATLGLGGHSSLILERSAPSGRVIGFEWDNQAVAQASSRLSVYGERFQLVHGSYADVVEHCHDLDLPLANGVLLDLGVSSLQLDTPERGFSFRSEASLDMRMGTSLKVTAADLVNRLKKDELADVFYNYGEERQARR
ncbi:MAG: 16S rRNA (cytosine(1402)-N(4))-methyltransferase, partial [Desulfobulbus sp.]